MKQVYTRTGDTGMTSLRGGMRVSKDDLRIEVNGQIDHLNALLGVVRAGMTEDGEGEGCDFPAGTASTIRQVQAELMTIMSHIATPDGEENPRTLHVEALTAQMEQAIDELTAGRSVGFILPGDSRSEAFVHLARTQCRTVERRLWTLHREHPLPTGVPQFFNRLSDYLFALSY